MGEIHKLTKDGITLFPATTTDAVVHPQIRTALSNMVTEYNVSNLFPTLGENKTNNFTLQGAISVLQNKLVDKQKVPGIKVLFIDLYSEVQEWRYIGGVFTDVDNWAREDSWYTTLSEDVEELENTLLNDALRKSEQNLTTVEKEQVKKNLDLNISAKNITWNVNSDLDNYIESGIYTIKGYRVNPLDNMPIINSGANTSIAAILMVLTGADTIGQNITISEGGDEVNTKIYSRTYNKNEDTWSDWVDTRQSNYVGKIYSLDLDKYSGTGEYHGTLTDFDKLNIELNDKTIYNGEIEFQLKTIGTETRCTQIFYPLSKTSEFNTAFIRTGNGSVFSKFTPVLTGYNLEEVLSKIINVNELNSNLETINTELNALKETVELLQMKNSDDFCVAAWDTNSLSPNCIEVYGNPEFCSQWDPYLLDTTDNEGEWTKPVGKLMKNNFLRFTDGSWAPVVGIKEERRAECDGELYWKGQNNDQELSKKYDAGTFNATEHYENYGVTTKLYKSDGTEVNVLRPWETTETKYTIGIGREKTVYLLDNVVGNSGKSWKGIFSKPTIWDGIDVSKYPLKPTAIGPGPCAVIDDNGVHKSRNFFYLYEGISSCSGRKGLYGSLCTMFKGGRTYPVNYDSASGGLSATQGNMMFWGRNNNKEVQSPVPFAEGGFHAWNTYVTSAEVLYGTKYLHSTSKFHSGISSQTCNSEDTWRTYGGVKLREKGLTTWKYAPYYNRLAASGFYYSNPINTEESLNFSGLLNEYAPKEQCMESQMAASYAQELGIPENTEFEFYGNTYRYINVPGAKKLEEGEMNVIVYKLVKGEINKLYNASGTEVTLELEVNLRISLLGGMNLWGDVFSYTGGGYETVGIGELPNGETGLGGFPIEIYLEPDQSKWTYETTAFSRDLNFKFSFESKYPHVGGKTFYNLASDGYVNKRVPYTGFVLTRGSNTSTGECMYSWSGNHWSAANETRKVRIGCRLRASSYASAVGARACLAYYSVATQYMYFSGSFQARLPEDL